MHLRSDTVALRNNAEINTGRILDIMELVDSSANMVEAVYVPVEKLASTVSLGTTLTLAIKLGCGLVLPVSFHNAICFFLIFSRYTVTNM